MDLFHKVETLGYSFFNEFLELKQSTDFITESCKNVTDNGKPFGADIVCSQAVLNSIMMYYYYADTFQVMAVKYKGTIYLEIKRNDVGLEKFKINDGKLLNVFKKWNIEGFEVLYNLKCNVNDLESLQDIKAVENENFIEYWDLTNSEGPNLWPKCYLRWLIGCILGIGMVHVNKLDSHQKPTGELLGNNGLKDQIKFYDMDVDNCYKYLKNFFNQVSQDLMEADVCHVYSFNRMLDCEIKKQNEFAPISFEKRQQELLSDDYIQFINRFNAN